MTARGTFTEPAEVQPNRSSNSHRSISHVQPTLGPVAAEGRSGGRTWVLLFFLAIVLFLLIECFVPLRTAVQIGADEGFELAKATLCLKGHKLYSEIWNDQPPLHTLLITSALRHLSPSAMGPRLITVSFAAILLASLFLIAQRWRSAEVGALAAALLLASPGFVELGSSCMVEIPSLAPAVAAIVLLLIAPGSRLRLNALLAGLVFGIALQMKLVPSILLPIGALAMVLRRSKSPMPVRAIMADILVLCLTAALSFVALDLLIDRGAFLVHFQQSWAAHFAAGKSAEYGSAADHPFDWILLLKNWDLTVPALVGMGVLTVETKTSRAAWLPLAWLALVLLVFTIHRPWWAYYYVHLAIPLAWCAAVGIAYIARTLQQRGRLPLIALGIAFGLALGGWMVARVYFEVANIRKSPKTFSTPVIAELRRYQAEVPYLYTVNGVYSFHSGIPMPPEFAVLSLKRFWSGDMTSAGLVAELKRIRPGLILLPNDSKEILYRDWLHHEYRLVYQDSSHLLYRARKASPGVNR